VNARGVVADGAARFFHSPVAGRFFTNAWYSLITALDRRGDARFLNYGFAALDGSRIALPAELEPDRYAIQLYDHVASRAALEGTDVLEVGCGRGGGASYIAAARRVRRYVGLDRNRFAITFDRRRYRRQHNLEFAAGDANALPFSAASFDAVLNVESSHHYGGLERFFAQVHRVLRPGGMFLMACFPARDEPSLHDAVRRAPFTCVLAEDVTANVVRALELDGARREEIVRRSCPPPLRPFAREFAGVPGSRLYEGFASGRVRYSNFVLRKATA